MNIKDIFLGADKKLRGGWRIAVYLPFLLISVTMTSIIISFLAMKSGVVLGEEHFLLLAAASNIFLIAVTLTCGWLCLLWFEGLTAKALGITPDKQGLADFLKGLLLGAVALIIAVATSATTGAVSFSPSIAAVPLITHSVLSSMLLLLPAALMEEVLFRGYVLQTLERSGRSYAWLAVIATSSFFAFAHLSNPNAELFGFGTLNTALAGVWFSLAYFRTGSLWLPFGMHFIWNWLQGPIFGLPVSGLAQFSQNSLLVATDNGPAWISGGQYGLEAGVACTIALGISIIWIASVKDRKRDQ